MENLTVINPLENITRIEYQGQPVLTTAQLAQFYETTENVLRNNFANNRDQYVEGKHYFKVTGDALNDLRIKNFDIQIPPMARGLYLWTKRGAFRHCKSVNTDRAWEVFELLEVNYFDRPANKQLADVFADYVALEREKFAVANSDETKTFAKAQLSASLPLLRAIINSCATNFFDRRQCFSSAKISTRKNRMISYQSFD
ncbi:MAG: ORF6N domain-containing protein [Selenomonadaceae bacterium]|nr:ORF6N domain-containing protein [Selenomonadaceae bacterium]